MEFSYGESIYYKVGKIIHPRDYKDGKEFIDAAID